MGNIIAFAGKKGSGKNTAANVLVAYELCRLGFKAHVNELGKILIVGTDGEGIFEMSNPSPHMKKFLEENLWSFIKCYAFADRLKLICMDLFGLTPEQVYGTNEQKNTATQYKWQNMLPCDIHSISNGQFGSITARQFMQYFATEICRSISPNCWAEAVIREIQRDQPSLAIITDLRFKSEAEAVKSAGGKVIQLLRSPYEDNHISENDLDDYTKFDSVIDNSKMSIGEQSIAIMNELVKMDIYQKA